jgi:quinol monooxygenase YgiN
VQTSVFATIKARNGREDEVREALLALISPTRAEEGCINYDLHQSESDPRIFIFYENWRSRRDLDEHLRKAHIQDFLERAEALLEGPVDIQLFRKIG